MLFFCSPSEFNSWLASLQECSKFILTGSEEHRTTISSKRIVWRKLRRGFWSSKSVDVIWTYIDCYLFLYNEMPYMMSYAYIYTYIWEGHIIAVWREWGEVWKIVFCFGKCIFGGRQMVKRLKYFTVSFFWSIHLLTCMVLFHCIWYDRDHCDRWRDFDPQIPVYTD